MTYQAKIADYLATHDLVHGEGEAGACCSVAAFNYALKGVVTIIRPPYMSDVLHRWIMSINDRLPLDRLNGRWKSILPHVYRTNDGRDDERIAMILDHMWGTVLPLVQPDADARGFGSQWRKMCEKRTEASAQLAHRAAFGFSAIGEASALIAYKIARSTEPCFQAAWAGWVSDIAAKNNPSSVWDAIDVENLLERMCNLGDAK